MQWKIFCASFVFLCLLLIASSPLLPGSDWMSADGVATRLKKVYFGLVSPLGLTFVHPYFWGSFSCTEHTDFALNRGYFQSTCLHFFALCFSVWSINKPRPQQEHESRAESLLRTMKRIMLCWKKSVHMNSENWLWHIWYIKCKKCSARLVQRSCSYIDLLSFINHKLSMCSDKDSFRDKELIRLHQLSGWDHDFLKVELQNNELAFRDCSVCASSHFNLSFKIWTMHHQAVTSKH